MQELTEHQQIHLRIIRQFPCLDFFVLHQFGAHIVKISVEKKNVFDTILPQVKNRLFLEERQG